MATDLIIEALPGMSEAELREVVSRASFLLNPSGTPSASAGPVSASLTAPDEDPALRRLWEEVQSVLTRHGEKVPPLRVVLRNKSFVTMLRRASSEVDRIARQGFRARREPELIKVSRLLTGLVARDLAKRDKLILRILLKRLQEPERVIERHFPGYLLSGLLPMLLARERVPSEEGGRLAGAF